MATVSPTVDASALVARQSQRDGARVPVVLAASATAQLVRRVTVLAPLIVLSSQIAFFTTNRAAFDRSAV